MIADGSLEYGTVEIDFPWLYKSPGNTHGANGGKGIRPGYGTWTDDRILNFEIPYRVAKQAHCWIWTPTEKERVVFAWADRHGWRNVNFTRVWQKQRPTGGMWAQGDAEYVRLFVKGKMFNARARYKSELGYFLRSHIGNPHGGPGGSWEQIETRRVHSAKPDVFYRETACMSPGPHLSLFQRFARPGWYGAGAEYEEGAIVFP